MAYFQNVFTNEFISPIGPLGDRQLNMNFKCPSNTGRSKEFVVSWNNPNFNLSINDADSNPRANLTFMIATNSPDFKEWGTFSVDITATSTTDTAVTPEDIITDLNANASFAGWFTASLHEAKNNRITRKAVLIRQKQQTDRMRFYIVNGGAEEALGFNARAGVAELPTYFARHTIANRLDFTDSLGMLIQLDPVGSDVDADIIDNAVDKDGKSLGYNSGVVQEDWELLKGNSDLFMFSKNDVDGSSRIQWSILYPAGAKVGDLAKKTYFVYDDGETLPSEVMEIPHVLESGDLLTPP